MSDSNDYIKKKASEFISLVSGLAEKKIHTIVERGAEQLSSIEKSIQDAYHTVVDNLEDWSNRFREKEPGEFTNGDLVISPVDIVYPGTMIFVRPNGEASKEDNIIKAGEVFEFKEELIPYMKTPLFEADTKAAIEWARLDELNKIKYWLDTCVDLTLSYEKVEAYYDKRKSDICQKKQEPENA